MSIENISREKSVEVSNKILDPKQVIEDFKAKLDSIGLELVVEDETNDDLYNLIRLYARKKDSKGDDRGRKLGSIQFDFDEKNKYIEIFSIRGKSRYYEADDWKPDGTGTLLLAYALFRFPEVKFIGGDMALDNKKIYTKIKTELEERNNSAKLDDKEIHKIAQMEMPFYKICKKFGFSKIKEDSSIGSSLLVSKE